MASASLLSADGAAPAVGKAAPAFRLADVARKPRSLAHSRAAGWRCSSSAAAHGALTWPVSGRIFSAAVRCRRRTWRERLYWGGARGGGQAADHGDRGFRPGRRGLPGVASRAGLDLAQTVLSPIRTPTWSTPDHADPCPRVFVIDGGGILRYTNNGKDDAPRKAPPSPSSPTLSKRFAGRSRRAGPALPPSPATPAGKRPGSRHRKRCFLCLSLRGIRGRAHLSVGWGPIVTRSASGGRTDRSLVSISPVRP